MKLSLVKNLISSSVASPLSEASLKEFFEPRLFLDSRFGFLFYKFNSLRPSRATLWFRRTSMPEVAKSMSQESSSESNEYPRSLN